MIFRGTKVFVKVIPVVFLVMLFAGCKPIASQPATACAPGTHDEEITSGGQVRQYRLHVPPAYQPGKPVPLLFGFHGAGSSAG